MNARLKLAITALLLCLALALTVFCAVQTVQAFQRFQQERQLVMTADVRAIRPWMTVPYIAHFYRVPESYLDQSLHITNDRIAHDLPLRDLASHVKRSLDSLIQDIQHAILNYRKHGIGAETNFLTHQEKSATKEPGRGPQGSPPTPTSTPASTMATNGQANNAVVIVEAGAGLGGVGTLAVAFRLFQPIRLTKKSTRQQTNTGEEQHL